MTPTAAPPTTSPPTSTNTSTSNPTSAASQSASTSGAISPTPTRRPRKRPEQRLVRIASKLHTAYAEQLERRHNDADTDFSGHIDRLLAHARSRATLLFIAANHGWTHAVESARADYADALATLSRAVDQLRERRSQLPESPPGLKDLFQELQATQDEFGQLEFDDGAVSVHTDPITLEGTRFVSFKFTFDPDDIVGDSPEHWYKVIAEEPNRASSDDQVTHPHVSGDRLCAGDAAAPIKAALRAGRLSEFFMLVRSVLGTYNGESAFVRLEDWDGIGCNDCGDTIDRDQAWYCEFCNHDHCESCIRSCRCCDSAGCRNCLTTSELSDEWVCTSCMAAEVLRVLCAHDAPSRHGYTTTLFDPSLAHREGCTARATLYCANIAAGLMVGQFAKWLRGLEPDADLSLNLLSAEGHAGVTLLQTIPGVGPRTAEAVAAYVDDPARFRSTRQAASYFGLVPRLDESAGVSRYGRITKDGPPTVRKYLIEAAWQCLRCNPSMRAFFERIQAGKKDRRSLALVATARHLAVVMVAMLKSGEVWRGHPVPAAA